MAQEDRSTYNPKTGQKTGSIAFSGKDVPTASAIVPTYRKGEPTNQVKNVQALEKAFMEADWASEKDAKDTVSKYNEARKKLDDALIALLPEVIANLKIGDRVDHVHIISRDSSEWDGVRAEGRFPDELVTEELLARFRSGVEIREPETPGDPVMTLTLLSISPTEDLDPNESAPTVISEDEWLEKYQPIENHFDPDTSWSGTVFETYGDELEFVASQDPNLVWTWIVDGDEYALISGFHLVNRMGYFVCKVPFIETQHGIEVDIS